MSKWIRKPRVCGHCSAEFYARGAKKFCSLDCTLRGSVRIAGNGCWEWQGSLVHGYGQVRTDSTFRYKRAHRVAYELWVGKLADGMCACHRCDNPKCINPDHLFSATSQENTKDKVIKGRQNRGESHGMTKIPAAALSEIMGTAGQRGSGAHLARKYGVTPAAICAIRKRKNWKHAV